MNIWDKIKHNGNMRPSTKRIQKERVPLPLPRVFVPKAILWTKRETSFKSMDLQTQLNNAIIQFLNKKVG